MPRLIITNLDSSFESFTFETIEELLKIPAVKREIESPTQPDIEELAEFEQAKAIIEELNEARIKEWDQLERDGQTPGGLFSDRPPEEDSYDLFDNTPFARSLEDDGLRIYRPIPPWVVRQDKFIRLTQTLPDCQNVFWVVIVERIDKNGNLCVDSLGILTDEVIGLPIHGQAEDN